MSIKIFVGFSTVQVPGAEAFVSPDLTAAQRKKVNLGQDAYSGRLSKVAVSIPYLKVAKVFKDTQGKPLTCREVVEFLLTTLGNDTWHDDTNPDHSKEPKAVFVGFDTRLFLKLIGLGCVVEGNPAPLGLWYGNSDHRDIESAIKPSDFKAITWDAVFARLRDQFDESDQEKWDKLTNDWVPGDNPVADVSLSIMLANRLGFKDSQVGGDTGATKRTKRSSAAKS